MRQFANQDGKQDTFDKFFSNFNGHDIAETDFTQIVEHHENIIFNLGNNLIRDLDLPS